MARDPKVIEALVGKIDKLAPTDLFILAAQLCMAGKEDVAAIIGRRAADELDAKRLGIVR